MTKNNPLDLQQGELVKITVEKVTADEAGISIVGRLPEGYSLGEAPAISLAAAPSILRGAQRRESDAWTPVDAINPSHYRRDIEVADFIEEYELDFFAGNVVKYIARAGHKDPSKLVEDLEKALWYMTRKVEVARKQRDDVLGRELIP